MEAQAQTRSRLGESRPVGTGDQRPEDSELARGEKREEAGRRQLRASPPRRVDFRK